MFAKPRTNAGFSLLEILIVVAIVGVVAAVLIPNLTPGREEELRAAGRMLAPQIDYARNLAVTYNSHYTVTFDLAQAQIVTEHSGDDTTLDVLPPSAFRAAGDPPDRHIFRLTDAVSLLETIQLVRVYADGDSPELVASVEFNAFGETTRAETTVIWLAAGSGDHIRYLPLEINPVTGLTTVGDPGTDPPPVMITRDKSDVNDGEVNRVAIDADVLPGGPISP